MISVLFNFFENRKAGENVLFFSSTFVQNIFVSNILQKNVLKSI
jgi:hypothetical protein